LPEGASFSDTDGFERKDIRVKWWQNPEEITWDEYSVMSLEGLPETKIETGHYYYPTEAKPVFFGHYWLRGLPRLMTENSCCLDYSVAKGYKLVAYRWDGVRQLNAANLIWVDVEQ